MASRAPLPVPSSISEQGAPREPPPRSKRAFGTRAVHPPAPPEQPGDPVAPLLDLSSTYAYSDTGDFARATQAKTGAGHVYARWSNPTVDAFEAAVADLEGAGGARAFSSGMAAIAAVFFALCSAGDKVVATRQLYGNTYSLLNHRLPRYGIEAVFCDLTDYAGIERALEGARLLYCETISNPRIQACDIPELAALAGSAGVPLVVDNTFASPALCKPLEHGASVVVHSATKALGGHHDLLGGIVCVGTGSAGPENKQGTGSAGPENKQGTGSAGPQNRQRTGSAGPENKQGTELLEAVAAVARDLGPTLAPFNAWLALRGIATLPLRVGRSCDTALDIARALEDHPGIEATYYPALDSDPGKPISERLFGGRGGTTLGFDVKGGRKAAASFQESLELVTPAASLGGTHSLIVHAASVTHTQLTPEELRAAGISEGFCRLSVGLEDSGDLIDDLHRALEATVT